MRKRRLLSWFNFYSNTNLIVTGNAVFDQVRREAQG